MWSVESRFRVITSSSASEWHTVVEPRPETTGQGPQFRAALYSSGLGLPGAVAACVALVRAGRWGKGGGSSWFSFPLSSMRTNSCRVPALVSSIHRSKCTMRRCFRDSQATPSARPPPSHAELVVPRGTRSDVRLIHPRLSTQLVCQGLCLCARLCCLRGSAAPRLRGSAAPRLRGSAARRGAARCGSARRRGAARRGGSAR